MAVPKDRMYAKTHEWHKEEAGLVTIGITDHAADELTDITFIKFPEIGRKVTAGGTFGEAESVKATSDLYSGIDGEVAEVNQGLETDPGLINRDPFGQGWIVKVRPSNPAQLKTLLTADEYEKTL